MLTGLVALEPDQAKLLDDICAGPLVSAAEVEAASAAAKAAAPLPAPVKQRRARGAGAVAGKRTRRKHDPKQGDLL